MAKGPLNEQGQDGWNEAGDKRTGREISKS
jgi:hypothetical protein